MINFERIFEKLKRKSNKINVLISTTLTPLDHMMTSRYDAHRSLNDSHGVLQFIPIQHTEQ